MLKFSFNETNLVLKLKKVSVRKKNQCGLQYETK